jgi:DNA-binding LytR/AlgR family response regulator
MKPTLFSGSKNSLASHDHANLKCLIIEDNRMHRVTLKRLLSRKLGFKEDNIIEAEDGFAALKILFSEHEFAETGDGSLTDPKLAEHLKQALPKHIDIIFLDNEMPVLSGSQLAQILNKTPYIFNVIHTTTGQLDKDLTQLSQHHIAKTPYKHQQIEKTLSEMGLSNGTTASAADEPRCSNFKPMRSESASSL